MASKNRIAKYYSLLDRIHRKIVNDGSIVSREEADDLLRDRSGVTPQESLNDISNERMNDLLEDTEFFASQIGIDTDKEIKLNI